MPKDAKFFDLFNAHAEQVVLGSKTLLSLLTVFNRSEEEAAKECDVIDEAEDRADEIKRETLRQLHKSFITPLDREEIHELSTELDGILDLIQDAAHTVALYNIPHITAEAVKLSELIVACTERVQKAVAMLPRWTTRPRSLSSAGKSITWNRRRIGKCAARCRVCSARSRMSGI